LQKILNSFDNSILSIKEINIREYSIKLEQLEIASNLAKEVTIELYDKKNLSEIDECPVNFKSVTNILTIQNIRKH
jgi:hypothetical protein